MKKVLFFIPLIFILFYWKNILLGISTKLIAWNDEPFVIWVLQNNIKHFRTLDFAHLYETNALYGFSNSLSFAEHLFFPSLIVTVLSFFISSPIAQFNILFILNHILIYVCAYILLNRFTKNMWALTIGSFFFAFCPYFFTQVGHSQMVFYWPLLLSLYFLLAPKITIKTLIATGVWAGLQFLSSVYLGIIALFIITLFYFVQAIFKKRLPDVCRELGIVILVFFIVSLVSIIGYVRMNLQYHPQRDYGDYVTFAANTTDYFFTHNQNSLLQKALFGKVATKYDKHTVGEMAAFVGVFPLLCIILYFFKFVRVKKMIEFKIPFDETKLFLFLLILCGFIFSLGPRLNVNGYYTGIPLPYHILLKIFPPLGIMRAVARWYFLMSLASGIIVVICIDKLLLVSAFVKKGVIISVLLFLAMYIEFYPSPIGASSKIWITPTTRFLRAQCAHSPAPLLEYPFEISDTQNHRVENLRYRTEILLASTQFACPILSGFSGYEPPKNLQFQSQLLNAKSTNELEILLVQSKFHYVKVDANVIDEQRDKFFQLIQLSAQFKLIYEDNNELIFKLQ